MLDVILWYVILGTLSLTTGDLVLRVLEKKFLAERMPKSIRLAVVFHIVPILGYTAFWIYMLNVHLGVILSCLLFLFVAAVGLRQLYRHGKLFFLDDDESKIQTVIMLCVPLIFLLVIALPLEKDKNQDNPSPLSERIADFFTAKTPVIGSADYLIQNVYVWGDSPWNYTLCAYKTTVSDRPPVIGGTACLFKTPSYLRTPSIKAISIPNFLGIAIFCCVGWIPACWGLLRSLGIPIRKCVFLLIILAFGSPAIFYSTTFCWPKMLGGTYMLVAYLLVDSDFRIKDALGRLAIPLAAVFVGFSLLCHLVNALIIPCIVTYFFIKRDIRMLQTVACGTIVFAIVASWYVPKMLYEAPHPSLLRYLVADSKNKDIYFKDCSDYQAIVDSYEQHSTREILAGKYRLIRKSLPPRQLTRLNLVNPSNLFTSRGHILFATATIGFLCFFRKTRPSHILQLKKLIFYVFIFMFLYVTLATISYRTPPCRLIFPTSGLLLSSLALLLGTSFLPEKCLLPVTAATIVLWLYLYLDNPVFIQLALIIAAGVLLIGATLKTPYIIQKSD